MLQVRPFMVFMVFLTIFPGCASSSKVRKLKESVVLPPLSTGIKQSTVTYEFSSASNFGTEQEYPEEVRQILEAEFIQVLRDSGYFSTIEQGSEGNGLHMKVRLVTTGSSSTRFAEMITKMTLFLIPTWGTYHFEMKANITTPSGRKEDFHFADSIRMFSWFPLILTIPFNNTADVIKEKKKNIYKNLLIRMKDNQILNL